MIFNNTAQGMTNYNYQQIRELCLQGPRVTTLFNHFETIAAGFKQFPINAILGSPDFLSQDADLKSYHDLLQQNIGTFTKHFCASVPYALEERCRMGLAIFKFAQYLRENSNDYFTYYETSSTDGTDARTMAEYSGGLIRTLTDSPNRANKRNFKQLSRHNYSQFHLGPFVDITPEFITSQPELHFFHNKFDLIHENATFQFYGSEREKQIAYLCRVLKKDGLMLFLEKLNQSDLMDYKQREYIKDKYYKSKYFSDAEIKWKYSNMLEEMEKGQVTLDELIEAIKVHFKYIYLTWNSTNFYKLAASNHESSIEKFVSFLVPQYVPQPFGFEEVIPRRLYP